MTPRLFRRALLVSFALYVTLGLPDGVLGTVWPSLRDDFGRSDSSFGLLILCSAVGYTGASIGAGHLTQRYGTGVVFRNASFAAVAGLGFFSLAPTWWTSMAAILILGAGWGLCDASVNAWVALTQGPREMGLLHAAYGVGALLGPLLAAPFISNGGLWRGPFLVVCGLGVALVGVAATAREGFDAAPVSGVVAGSPAPERGSRQLLGLLIVWFSIYVGIEVTVGQWSFTLLNESRGYSDVKAATLVTGFWCGLTLGRFLLAGFGDRFSPEHVLATAIGVTAVGMVFFWVDPVGAGALALPVIGLSLASMFPLAMGRTAVYLGEARAARAVGYQIAASSVGFVILPAFVGVLADYHGVGVALPVVFAATCVLALLWLLIQVRLQSARSGPV
ncbi:MAG: MFS transporter [Acidimicrobiaceae bacterium]|nr:MFS transporter [Acidimicrobiaceae bacterium]